MVIADDVQGWLDRYVEAWRTYDPSLIADLFTDEAEYGYEPWGEPIRGRDAIVTAWLGNPDPPGSWEAEYSPVFVCGDRAAVRGRTRYASGKVFENLWMLQFDVDGRCSSFEEWYMEPPGGEG